MEEACELLLWSLGGYLVPTGTVLVTPALIRFHSISQFPDKTCQCASPYSELDSHRDWPAALQSLEEGARAFLLQDLTRERDGVKTATS